MYTAAVITVSDKGYRGERADTSGPNLVEILKDRGFDVTYTSIVPDDRDMIRTELLKQITCPLAVCDFAMEHNYFIRLANIP